MGNIEALWSTTLEYPSMGLTNKITGANDRFVYAGFQKMFSDRIPGSDPATK